MKHHLFDVATGFFTGRSMDASPDVLAANCPDGFAWVDGVTDWRSQRVELGTGAIVDYMPPSPGADYEWDSKAKRWVLSAEARVRNARKAAAAAEIARLEAEVQPRIIRELRLAEIAGRMDSAAATRLQELDARIAELRVDLG